MKRIKALVLSFKIQIYFSRNIILLTNNCLLLELEISFTEFSFTEISRIK